MDLAQPRFLLVSEPHDGVGFEAFHLEHLVPLQECVDELLTLCYRLGARTLLEAEAVWRLTLLQPDRASAWPELWSLARCSVGFRYAFPRLRWLLDGWETPRLYADAEPDEHRVLVCFAAPSPAISTRQT